MIQRAFQHRSGRVIALSRLVLAVIFFFAVWIDPKQPARNEFVAYPLLLAYAAASAALLAASWNSWWLDYRLARGAHGADVFIFLASVYFTEGYTSTFTSPFFAFFAYLLLSATLRWGWRGTAATAMVAILLYFLLGLVMQIGTPDFDGYRFGRRVAYLVVLSFVLVWFGINQHHASARHRPGELEIEPGATAPPTSAALRYAAARMGASRGLFVWWTREEPWIVVTELRGLELTDTRYGPLEFGSASAVTAGDEPFLFDLRRGRALYRGRGAGGEFRAILQPMAEGFADRLGLSSGIAIPIRAGSYAGELFLTDVPGLCCDDLHTGSTMADEIAQALDRYSLTTMNQEAAVSRTREAMARDLHDSVAQVLAGASFRLEALRNWIKAGEDPDAEIVAIKDALRTEQRHVRELIAKLRLGAASTRKIDLAGNLAALAAELSTQWSRQVRFASPQGEIEVPAWFAQELNQLVREAAANAFRHGRADTVTVVLQWTELQICLIITDDGDGFLGGDSGTRPWSIHERAKSLGGTLSLQSTGAGVTLEVKLPREDKP